MQNPQQLLPLVWGGAIFALARQQEQGIQQLIDGAIADLRRASRLGSLAVASADTEELSNGLTQLLALRLLAWGFIAKVGLHDRGKGVFIRWRHAQPDAASMKCRWKLPLAIAGHHHNRKLTAGHEATAQLGLQWSLLAIRLAGIHLAGISGANQMGRLFLVQTSTGEFGDLVAAFLKQVQ